MIVIEASELTLNSGTGNHAALEDGRTDVETERALVEEAIANPDEYPYITGVVSSKPPYADLIEKEVYTERVEALERILRSALPRHRDMFRAYYGLPPYGSKVSAKHIGTKHGVGISAVHAAVRIISRHARAVLSENAKQRGDVFEFSKAFNPTASRDRTA